MTHAAFVVEQALPDVLIRQLVTTTQQQIATTVLVSYQTVVLILQRATTTPLHYATMEVVPRWTNVVCAVEPELQDVPIQRPVTSMLQQIVTMALASHWMNAEYAVALALQDAQTL